MVDGKDEIQNPQKDESDKTEHPRSCPAVYGNDYPCTCGERRFAMIEIESEVE